MALVSSLDKSRASAAFREGVASFLRTARANETVRYNPGCPPVKVERTLTWLLEMHPELEVDSVEIDARSGCEYFRGTLTAVAGEETRAFRFEWNCLWKAEEMGWRDAFGMPDQIRAARTFQHDCFRIWEEIPAEVAAG